jgi:undecaprenyl diphosphate synthase
MADREAIPQHIGYIVDGNRRWAKGHGLPTYEGHLAGYNAIIEVVLASIDAGVKYVSAYTFSTENWKRSELEVSKIMGLVLRLLTSDIHILQDNGIRLKVLGSRDRLSKSVLKAIDEAESKTAGNTRGTLAVCFNYGGQLEIVDACKKIVQEGIAPEDITTELITEHLYVSEVPPLDVVVRTSGEQRTSNFMLWRAAYSEFIFLEKLWPDMTKDDVTAILEEYSRRGRRFGG